jgi:hypothetical protein
MDHDIPCCSTCAVVKHRTCQHVLTIDDAAYNFVSSKETDKITHDLEMSDIESISWWLLDLFDLWDFSQLLHNASEHSTQIHVAVDLTCNLSHNIHICSDLWSLCFSINPTRREFNGKKIVVLYSVSTSIKIFTAVMSSLNESDVTTCSICLQQFNIPKYLPCLHTFCQTCMSTLEQHGISWSIQNSSISLFLCSKQLFLNVFIFWLSSEMSDIESISWWLLDLFDLWDFLNVQFVKYPSALQRVNVQQKTGHSAYH